MFNLFFKKNCSCVSSDYIKPTLWYEKFTENNLKHTKVLNLIFNSTLVKIQRIENRKTSVSELDEKIHER